MNFTRKYFLTICVLQSFALLLFSIRAWGQDFSDTDYLSPFNVIGKQDEVLELKGSGSKLSSDQLKIFFHTDVNEIFREIPGVYLRPEEGYGLFPNISLRGVDSHRSAKVTIMEDGIPSSPSPFSDPAAYYSPTAGRMSGFEILKGSSQLKYGPNTTGGIINYISTPIPDVQSSNFRTTYGEFNERVAHVYSGGKTNFGKGTLGFLIEVFDHRSDGWKSINPLGNLHGKKSPFAKNDITLKLSYEFGEDDYLEVKAGRTDLNADVSYIGLSAEDFALNPYQRYHNTKLDNMDSEQNRYYLRYLKQIDESTSLKATLFHNEFDRDWYKVNKVRVRKNDLSYDDWVSIGQGAFDNVNHVNMLKGSGEMSDTALYDGNGQVRYKHNDRNYKNTGVQTSFEKEWGNHAIELGLKYTKDHYIYKDFTEDLYNVSNSNDASGALSYDSTVSGSKGNGKDRISRAWETYLTDTITLDKISLSPGLRYTSVEYSYNSNKKTLDDILFGIGGGYALENHLVFAGIHQGHALPGFNGASGMEEEQSLGFEIGSRGSLNFLSYEIAYFRTKIDNMIAVPSLASGLGDDALNIGEATIDGIELLLSKDLNEEGSFSFPVTFSSTFTSAEFDSSTGFDSKDRYTGGMPGNKIPYVPEMQYNLRAGLVFEKLSTFLNYHWQDDIFVDATNVSTINDYGIVDWSAFYEFSSGAKVFSKVSNLTDEMYATSDMPEGLRPGAPRIATIGLEFSF